MRRAIEHLRAQGATSIQLDADPPGVIGHRAELLVDLRGAEADALIEPLRQAAAAYPWPSEYRAWPGPNSNTFVAWIARQVPELELDLPFSAIGSGYADRDPPG